jgi:hypothetical protein
MTPLEIATMLNVTGAQIARFIRTTYPDTHATGFPGRVRLLLDDLANQIREAEIQTRALGAAKERRTS